MGLRRVFDGSSMGLRWVFMSLRRLFEILWISHSISQPPGIVHFPIRTFKSDSQVAAVYTIHLSTGPMVRIVFHFGLSFWGETKAKRLDRCRSHPTEEFDGRAQANDRNLQMPWQSVRS